MYIPAGLYFLKTDSMVAFGVLALKPSTNVPDIAESPVSEAKVLMPLSAVVVGVGQQFWLDACADEPLPPEPPPVFRLPDADVALALGQFFCLARAKIWSA